MKRRSLLATTALGSAAALGGCGSNPQADDETATATRPDDCPETPDVDVSLPDSANESETGVFVRESEVETFLKQHEEALVSDSLGTGGRVTYSPTAKIQEVEDAAPGTLFRVEVTWSTTTMIGVVITAEVRETVPEEAIARDIESLPDDAERIADVAREAVADGESATWKDRTIDHEPILSALERAFDDAETYYVTVDGQPVRVDVTPASEGVDDGHSIARYYVDEAVVRRTTDSNGDPRDGELVACFPAADD